MTTLDSQITKAREYLARFKTDTLGHFINGEWTLGSGEDTFENQSPINNKRLGTVVKGSAEDVNQACLAAQNAFEEWANFSGAKRRQILHKLADEIERRAEEIALVESVDCGQAFRFMKQAAVRGAANFRFFADKAPEAKNGDSLFQESHTNFTVRTPIACGCHHTLEYTVHALHVENCASTCRRLYRCSQACGIQPSQRGYSRGMCASSRIAKWCVEHGERVW
ncbi:hypothetical protein TUMSATVNIG3_54130 [Vibrio nigripulchritudo]|nr:hypothetical protein TUMSATVNIG3_54130 [Vibrio nigripulchritudo]